MPRRVRIESERTAPLLCWKCGRINDGRTHAVDVDRRDKVDGDVSVCWYCGALSMFVGTPPYAVRKPTDEEMVQLKADPSLQSLLNRLAVYRISRGGSL